MEWTAIASAAAAIATCGLAVATVWLGCEARKSAKAAEKSVEQSRKAADATKDLATETARLAEETKKMTDIEVKRDEFLRRPYVILEEGRITDLSHAKMNIEGKIRNISGSPALEVYLNFYCHNMPTEQLSQDSGEGNDNKVISWLFASGELLSDGIGPNDTKELRLDFQRIDITSNDNNLRLHEFTNINTTITSAGEEFARYSLWNAVISYKGINGESYFSVYKYKFNPSVGGGHVTANFVFSGFYRGIYDQDGNGHKFIQYRGFPNVDMSPPWDAVGRSDRNNRRILQVYKDALRDSTPTQND
ncbi:hypothetical protein ACJU26_08575 [Acidithiobacillus sp. M4-SHS-6]|uniref:hypothetical protein n=1 Tax=Acidithiobacillus sp. M4-SHS-6 TaxID=3383024 RepID=UPI0039BE1A6F